MTDTNKLFEAWKEGRRLWCRKCESEMKVFDTTDMLDMVSGNHAYYCDNSKCKRYGDLTVAGLKLSTPKTE